MLDSFNLKNDSVVSVTDCGSSVRVSLCNISKKSVKWHTMVSLRYGRKMKEYLTDHRTGEILKNPESERRSVRRARVAIVDLAKVNKFEYFGTITIDSDKHNVLNVRGVADSLRKALHSYEKLSPGFKYIVVPEFGSLHNRLHFHFLFKNIRETDLFLNEHKKLDHSYFRSRFGFVQITKIQRSRADIERTAKYCGKYMSKDNIQIGGHRYFRSKGLLKPEKHLYTAPFVANWINKFMSKYEDTCCYYAEKCKCYDIPLPLFNVLSRYIIDRMNRWKWVSEIQPYEKIEQLRLIV